MNVSSAKPGDIVLVDKKGRRFHAEIESKKPRAGSSELRIKPLDARISYYTAAAREVKGLWHKSRQRARTRAQARPDSCPDCGAPCTQHTGSYCQECGHTLDLPAGRLS